MGSKKLYGLLALILLVGTILMIICIVTGVQA